MLHSLDCFVDPVSSGLIGILPDSTAGLLRFKCVLNLVAVSVMVSALKPEAVLGFKSPLAATPFEAPSSW